MKAFSEDSRLGSELSYADQSHVLSAYVNRYTKQHKPKWANGIWKDGLPYPVQFASDADWLANTRFAVTKAGKLDRRCHACKSTSTWPDNPELRIQSA